MSAVVLAAGACGELVRQLQGALDAKGFSPGIVDGKYGATTSAAVRGLQAARGIPQTGEADPATWTAATGEPSPAIRDRALQVTASFEGHGFELAQGNFDGAGITWGIIGFTLKHGEIQKIIQDAQAMDLALVAEAFGSEAAELLSVIDRPPAAQLAWADSLSLGVHRTLLKEPWRSHFAAFGREPAVKALQLSRVDEDYFQPSIETAARYSLVSELGRALCFDIHVQNGGIGALADQLIEARRSAIVSESDLRVVIANAVADTARAQYREDVRARKVALAKGSGTVHGLSYTLRSWGLDESEA